ITEFGRPGWLLCGECGVCGSIGEKVQSRRDTERVSNLVCSLRQEECDLRDGSAIGGYEGGFCRKRGLEECSDGERATRVGAADELCAVVEGRGLGNCVGTGDAGSVGLSCVAPCLGSSVPQPAREGCAKRKARAPVGMTRSGSV